MKLIFLLSFLLGVKGITENTLEGISASSLFNSASTYAKKTTKAASHFNHNKDVIEEFRLGKEWIEKFPNSPYAIHLSRKLREIEELNHRKVNLKLYIIAERKKCMAKKSGKLERMMKLLNLKLKKLTNQYKVMTKDFSSFLAKVKDSEAPKRTGQSIKLKRGYEMDSLQELMLAALQNQQKSTPFRFNVGKCISSCTKLATSIPTPPCPVPKIVQQKSSARLVPKCSKNATKTIRERKTDCVSKEMLQSHFNKMMGAVQQVTQVIQEKTKNLESLVNTVKRGCQAKSKKVNTQKRPPKITPLKLPSKKRHVKSSPPKAKPNICMAMNPISNQSPKPLTGCSCYMAVLAPMKPGAKPSCDCKKKPKTVKLARQLPPLVKKSNSKPVVPKIKPKPKSLRSSSVQSKNLVQSAKPKSTKISKTEADKYRAEEWKCIRRIRVLERKLNQLKVNQALRPRRNTCTFPSPCCCSSCKQTFGPPISGCLGENEEEEDDDGKEEGEDEKDKNEIKEELGKSEKKLCDCQTKKKNAKRPKKAQTAAPQKAKKTCKVMTVCETKKKVVNEEPPEKKITKLLGKGISLKKLEQVIDKSRSKFKTEDKSGSSSSIMVQKSVPKGFAAKTLATSISVSKSNANNALKAIKSKSLTKQITTSSRTIKNIKTRSMQGATPVSSTKCGSCIPGSTGCACKGAI